MQISPNTAAPSEAENVIEFAPRKPFPTAGSHRGTGSVVVDPKPSERVLASLHEQLRLTDVILAELDQKNVNAVLHLEGVAFRPGRSTLAAARVEVSAQREQIIREIKRNGGGGAVA
jgi:hypothetical protein